MLKKILIFLGALIALLLVIAIFLPSSYRVERSITINAPVEKVFNNVADLNNYLKWNPWSKLDPAAKYDISDKSKGVGASWAWEGETIGKGTLSLVQVDEYSSIKTKLVFTEPRQDEGTGIWTFEPAEAGIKVSWAMEGELGYPISRYMGLMIDGMLGKDFEQGLASLKELSEK